MFDLLPDAVGSLDPRGCAEALVRVRAIQRQAEAAEVRLLVQLAGLYGVFHEDELPEPTQERIPCGPDGVPDVGEFLALELAGLLRMSPASANRRLRDALTVVYRHPALWRCVAAGELELWRANRIAQECVGLTLAQCPEVDRRLAPFVGVVTWARLLRRLRGLIVAADTEAAVERMASGETRRFVHVGTGDGDGTNTIVACLSCADAAFLDAMVDRLADILGEQGDEATKDVRRATALGVLARPARALDLLKGAHAGSTRALPEARLYVHVSQESLRSRCGVARVEGSDWPVPVDYLGRFLAHSTVRVTPVLDLEDVEAVDAYEIPERIREAVRVRDPYEMFPFSARRSRGRHMDLDHTTPYVHGADRPPGQTRLDNLVPLSRRVHRAKTHGGWQLTQELNGELEWTTPLGFRYRVGPDGTRNVPETDERFDGPSPPGAA